MHRSHTAATRQRHRVQTRIEPRQRKRQYTSIDGEAAARGSRGGAPERPSAEAAVSWLRC